MRRETSFAFIFLTIFCVLFVLYSWARGTWIEWLLVDKLTAAPASWFVNLVFPEFGARASGHRIVSDGGSLSILGGCEGTEPMLLLIAAFLAFPQPLKSGFAGMFLGVLLVYLLNQVRIVLLFYAFRVNRPLFDLLHGFVGPAVIILLGTLFFVWWTGRSVAPPRECAVS